MSFLIAFLWAIVGIIIALPYNFLAGGDSYTLLVTICIAPVAAVLLFFFYPSIKIKGFKSLFLLFALWCCLPILLNGISVLLKFLGKNETANFLFMYRYTSLIVVPFIILIGDWIWDKIKASWNGSKMKSNEL